MSGSSGTPSESGSPSKRRRKRRSGRGPKGNGAVHASGTAPVPAQGTESSSVPAETGSVKQGQGTATSVAGGSEHSQTERNRKKRRRGKKRRPEQAQPQGVQADQAAQSARPDGTPEKATSLKGKKAARRRGRRRRQAANGGQDQATNTPQPQPSESRANQSQQINGAVEPVQARTDKPDAPERRQGQHRTEPRRQHRHNQNRDHGRSGANGHQLYAALDLGTNNCRLLIARPEERGFRVIDAYSRIVRLGEGVGSNKRLSDAAMDRAIDALAQCHRKLADRGVMRSRLIATEACRAAENGSEFIDRVRSETGLALEVVNRETEARLAVAGCASLVSHEADGVILFDIGGGSSEIVWLDLRNRCGARGYALTRFIRSWISLPVGVVNLAERHGGVHVTPDIFEAMVEDAADHLAGFSLADNLSEAIASGRVHMLGTSGTVTTLAGVHLGLKRYDRRRVDGTWLRDEDVSGMIDQLRDMPYEARVENPCIGADRADLVLAGCAILEAIRRRWTCSRLRVADRGLREGILTELMAADGVWARKRSGHRNRGSRQRNRA